MKTTKKPIIITCDAGGTMTDIFAIDERGDFVIGKAATTPQDESLGYWESLADALSYWQRDLEKEGKELIPSVELAIYTGTAAVNTILQRKGKRVGLLITKGFEDVLTLERGYQATTGLSYADSFHTVTHYNNPPLIPRKLTQGATERIDCLGREIIPLYENDVREAVRELLDQRVEALVILFLHSYVNESHEVAAGQIAREVMAEMDIDIPIYLSSEICPIMREVSRLNSVVVHAAISDLLRTALSGIERKLRDSGFKYPLNVLLAYGGLADMAYPRLYEAMVSGPIGGFVGGIYLSEMLGLDNIVTTDVGGTSFDVGLITAGVVPITREPKYGRLIFNMPMMVVNSVGQGTGTYIRLEPFTNRILLGPESAGADPGPVCYDLGNEIPTVGDCDLLLGILNPNYYLGGKVKLNKEKAYRFFKEKIADPLGMDVYEAAEGVVELSNLRAYEAINEMILSRGYTPQDYTLVAFGGAGPMHMAGYAEMLGADRVMTMEFAAAFSAFGAATVDAVHRFHKSTRFVIPSEAPPEYKMNVATGITQVWEVLSKAALDVTVKEGYKREDVTLTYNAFVRYGEQLDDVEVTSPIGKLSTIEDLDAILNEFENKYSQLYGLGAKYPQGGFQILELAVISRVTKKKPVLPIYPLSRRNPDSEAYKGTRKVYHKGQWHEAPLYEMSLLKAGNEIEGIAILEAPATTLFIPPGKNIRLDEYRFMWLE